MMLTELLVREFDISEDEINRAVNYQKKHGGKLEKILVNMGSLSDAALAPLYAKLFDLPLIDLSSIEKDETVESDIDTLALRELDWVPIEANGSVWTVACHDPLNLLANEWIAEHNIQASLVIATESDISILKNKYQSNETGSAAEDFTYSDAEEERLLEMATEAPTVNLLNSLISRGLRQGASDMHLEPYEGSYRVRYRIDGVLHEVERLSSRMELPLVTRLKILSGMDIAEKRRPQDGKIEMRIASIDLDIRVSALPLNEGESVVMRFLRKDNVKYDMSVIGMSEDIESSIKEDLKTTAGVILLTGPTGSGKTTTLYTFLNALNTDGVKIVTLEDPVEYQLEGINQVQVNSEIGFDFAAGLRSIVRQDPDIIMLGEIRDKETAQIALQSALTGHLVFSTVHTNDAAGAYTRLLDLGVEEFLLNAAIVSIVAQRLARKVCPHCARPHPEQESLITKYQLDQVAQRFNVANINLLQGEGCEECGHTGYKGRIAVTEYLKCDDHIKSLPKDADFIRHAQSHNFDEGRRTLLEDGLLKAIKGTTTIEEVVRVAG